MNNDESEQQRQINRQNGMEILSGMLSGGMLGSGSPEDPSEHVAVQLASGHNFVDTNPKLLHEVEDQKRAKDFGGLLEVLGQTGPLSNPKDIKKFMVKANQLVSRAPGARGLGLNDAKSVTHAVLSAVSKNVLEGLQGVIEHSVRHAKNAKKIKAHVDSLFGDKPVEYDSIDDKHRDKIKAALDLVAGVPEEPTKMAEGGQVAPGDISPAKANLAYAFPEQAMLLQAAKARAHGYLNSLKPQKAIKLPFDKDSSQKDKEKQYHSAIDIAANPLAVLGTLKSGRITPIDFSHFTALHPELHSVLKNEIMKRISEDKKPNSTIRQGLSLFIGQPLESNLSPQAIQAVQTVFVPKAPPQQQGTAPKMKKGTSPLSKFSKEYETKEQARDSRANK